jgi:hypothetical protein
MNNLSKELRKYGFAQSSQEAISQAGAIYGASNKEEVSAEIEAAQMTRAQLNELINRMQRLWVFKENSDQKVSVIADQVVKVTDKLNELIKSISLIEMNQAVFDKKLNTLRDNVGDSPRQESRSYDRGSRERDYREDSRHVEESSTREREASKKLDKPIDRNGVAPADVSIQKIFYCGNK